MPWKVVVDFDKCQSNAVCQGIAPEVFEVRDDGRGFDPVSAENGAGMGLAAMRERTESMGGRFCVWSAPGEGTRVLVEFPS